MVPTIVLQVPATRYSTDHTADRVSLLTFFFRIIIGSRLKTFLFNNSTIYIVLARWSDLCVIVLCIVIFLVLFLIVLLFCAVVSFTSGCLISSIVSILCALFKHKCLPPWLPNRLCSPVLSNVFFSSCSTSLFVSTVVVCLVCHSVYDLLLYFWIKDAACLTCTSASDPNHTLGHVMSTVTVLYTHTFSTTSVTFLDNWLQNAWFLCMITCFLATETLQWIMKAAALLSVPPQRQPCSMTRMTEKEQTAVLLVNWPDWASWCLVSSYLLSSDCHKALILSHSLWLDGLCGS